MSPSKVLVVVPTTSGPLRLRGLKPRPRLPASAAFADGDYRPLPWSGDYARLSSAGGPLARLTGDGLAPHELRLSGSFDAGRSWETPICLAHGLAARGHAFVGDAAEADLILWATGAVDLDLAVIPGDYALLDKIERSRALLAEAPGATLAVLLPEGPERLAAQAAIRALGRDIQTMILPHASVPTALSALAQPADPKPARPKPARQWRYALPLGATAAVGVAAAVAFGVQLGPSVGPPPQSPATGPTASVPQKATTAVADPAQNSPEHRDTSRVRIEELRAVAGSSCRRVVFGADQPERHAVASEPDGRLAPTQISPDLCGLAIRAEKGAAVEIGPELRSASLPPVQLPDGSQAYFLKASGRQNLVYTVQVSAGSGSPGTRLVHALKRGG